jgi:hypothetical protein
VSEEKELAETSKTLIEDYVETEIDSTVATEPIETSFANSMTISMKEGHSQSIQPEGAEIVETPENSESTIDNPSENQSTYEDSEEDEVDEIGELDVEIDEDLADANAPDQEVVLENFEPRKNRYKKGTLKWIREEHEIVSENVIFLEKEFAKLKNVLKVGVATFKSAKETSQEREQELNQFLSAQESLNEWISERKGTYAWQLLSALSKERDKLAEFEKEIQNWVEVQTQDLYEEARDNKKRFLRKFRISFGGLIFSLILGYLVNLLLSALGLGWIPMVLTFLGITNPIGIISQVIGFGAIFSWFFAFVFYFRDYSKWRKRLNKEVADARFFLKAVSDLSVERGRLRFLHVEMLEFLAMMAKILHKPWVISENWINYEGTNLDSSRLPKAMDVAVPREVGAFNDVKRKAMEHLISQNWRDAHIDYLFAEYEKRNAMRLNSISERIDADSRLRKKLVETFPQEELLESVGDKLIQLLTEYVQREVLPNETRFNVDSIKPDELQGLKMKSALFDSSTDLTTWQDFIAEILGPVGSWQQINFTSSGQLENLFDRKKIISYALIPDRLSSAEFNEIKPHVVEKDDKSGVEVIVRVDVSTWIDGDKIT